MGHARLDWDQFIPFSSLCLRMVSVRRQFFRVAVRAITPNRRTEAFYQLPPATSSYSYGAADAVISGVALMHVSEWPRRGSQSHPTACYVHTGHVLRSCFVQSTQSDHPPLVHLVTN